MATKRKYLILGFLLVFSVFILFLYLWYISPKFLISRLDEERKIYSVIISKDDVLTDTTELGWFDTEEYGDYIEKGFPELEEETLSDYQEINKREYYIKDYLPIGTPHVLLTNAEIEQIYQDGWQSFNSKYPNEHGIISFSRIGFNSRFTQALVLKGYGSPAEDENEGGYSKGTFILLEKKQGIWAVIAELTAWIS